MCKAKLVLISSMCARCSFAYADKWWLTEHFIYLVVYSWPNDFVSKLCEYWCLVSCCIITSNNCCPAFVNTEITFKIKQFCQHGKREPCAYNHKPRALETTQKDSPLFTKETILVYIRPFSISNTWPLQRQVLGFSGNPGICLFQPNQLFIGSALS